MVKQAAITRCNRQIADDAGISPCSAGNIAVVPNLLNVVIDHIAIIQGCAGRAVEPPYLIESVTDGSKHLLDLLVVKVPEHMLAQVARQSLNPAIVDVELLFADPIHNPRRNAHCPIVQDGYVVGQ